MEKIIVAVTGASGAIYARKVLEHLISIRELKEIALILSDCGQAVMEYECGNIVPEDPRIRVWDNADMFAPAASGSSGYGAMVIVPCSAGSAGRIAAGVSSDLIGRAADVMIKERRPLILVIRETPLSTIHLRNLTALSECGALILPASPSFYSHPQSIDELCDTVAQRVMKLVGFPCEGFRWGEGEGRSR